jgi:protein-disulfide isomerase
LLGHRYIERVADDVATADASGVVGTPTFFINGKRHHGAYNRAALASAVDAARARGVSIKPYAA